MASVPGAGSRLHGDDCQHDAAPHLQAHVANEQRDEDAPERILAKRLGSGEIDVAEFERRRDALQRAANSPVDEMHTAKQQARRPD
jgi:hypothetical protein